MLIFSCGKADNSRRGKCSFFLSIIWSKKGQNSQNKHGSICRFFISSTSAATLLGAKLVLKHPKPNPVLAAQAALFLIIYGATLIVASLLRVLAWLAPWPYINDINEKNAGFADFVCFIMAIWGSIQVFGESNEQLSIR